MDSKDLDSSPDKDIDTPAIIKATPHVLADLRVTIDGVSGTKAQKEAGKFTGDMDKAAFVIYAETSPCGYIEVNLDEEVPREAAENLSGFAHVARIGVARQFRGRGFGTKLLLSAENWARDKGKPGAWLEYREDNKRAEGLYNSAGYKQVGRFSRSGVNRIIVAKKLE